MGSRYDADQEQQGTDLHSRARARVITVLVIVLPVLYAANGRGWQGARRLLLNIADCDSAPVSGRWRLTAVPQHVTGCQTRFSARDDDQRLGPLSTCTETCTETRTETVLVRVETVRGPAGWLPAATG